ncbi:MAG: hypothetical protein ABH849_03945 [Nanoarchaeota archaeon]
MKLKKAVLNIKADKNFKLEDASKLLANFPEDCEVTWEVDTNNKIENNEIKAIGELTFRI